MNPKKRFKIYLFIVKAIQKKQTKKKKKKKKTKTLFWYLLKAK